jgi:hypothetical protein
MEDVGIFYGHLVYFVVIWYIIPRFGMLYQEKSGNPVCKSHECKSHACKWLQLVALNASSDCCDCHQGCQMVNLHTKNLGNIVGIFYVNLVYFSLFGIFYRHVV